MKKFFVLLIPALVVLSGCQELPTVNQSDAKFNNLKSFIINSKEGSKEKQLALYDLAYLQNIFERNKMQGTYYSQVDISLEEIIISPFSASADWDRDGLDDGLELLIVPKDKYGDTVKVVGTFTVTLYRYGPLSIFGNRGEELVRWQVDSEQANDSWVDSTFSGFLLKLPWRGGIPDATRCVVEVVFTSVMGQEFKTEFDTIYIGHNSQG